jgi:tRNA pseudouridine32 synthase / 23S rRNA pseudouridine746 synthase
MRRREAERALRPMSGPRSLSAERGEGAPLGGRERHDGLVDRLLYRDGLMLVVDKPAGIAVHKGPGGGPDLESGFDALRFGLPHPPALAHRLDRDTSGCLVLGRHPRALRRLGALFAAGQIEKVYWAVVAGRPPQDVGRVETGLKKLTHGGGWRMIADPAGQRAVTEYRLRGAAGGIAWLELRPRTGRTHQIRVHCAVLGCPIVGDPVYGEANGRQLLLHAWRITLPLYPTKPPIVVTATPSPHMVAVLVRLGYDITEPDGAKPFAKPASPAEGPRA